MWSLLHPEVRNYELRPGAFELFRFLRFPPAMDPGPSFAAALWEKGSTRDIHSRDTKQ